MTEPKGRKIPGNLRIFEKFQVIKFQHNSAYVFFFCTWLRATISTPAKKVTPCVLRVWNVERDFADSNFPEIWENHRRFWKNYENCTFTFHLPHSSKYVGHCIIKSRQGAPVGGFFGRRSMQDGGWSACLEEIESVCEGGIQITRTNGQGPKYHTLDNPTYLLYKRFSLARR